MSDLIRSWVDTANDPEHQFPLNNLPFGVFSDRDPSRRGGPRCATAIGDFVLDLAAMQSVGVLPRCGFDEPALNTFMSLGPTVWDDVRQALTDLLRDDSTVTTSAAGTRETVRAALHRQDDVTLHLPFDVAEFTDFYAGRQHAVNVGSMFRDPQNALPPNWLHIPIGYNGRASTVVVSGTDIHRPCGQTKSPDDAMPSFGPSRRLDIELELGAVVGTPSQMGRSVSVDEADAMIFGYVLLNDWSARDIQTWEYQPLGPFQAKAFATTISPWVVTKAALEPFRCTTPTRDAELLTYIRDTGPMNYGIELAIDMAAAGGEPTVISRTNSSGMYYSSAQQLAHHTSSGCAMRTGDLLGSGTISGADAGTYGSLLELCWGGETPFTLDSGETRTFVEDGDTLTLHGRARGDGYVVGFGPCAGTVIPARTATT